jgi:hypothetical protein
VANIKMLVGIKNLERRQTKKKEKEKKNTKNNATRTAN